MNQKIAVIRTICPNLGGSPAMANLKAQSKDHGPANVADRPAAAAILSNGSYSVLLSPAGAGWATWKDFDVTRWREDATRDCWGQFCYVRDLVSNAVWSIGRQPVFSPRNAHEYSFHGDRAEFRCRAGDIEISWAVCVASHTDAEVRALRVENRGTQRRVLEFTSLFRGVFEQPTCRHGTSGVRQTLRGNGI